MNRGVLFVQLDSIACTVCLHGGKGTVPGTPVILAGRFAQLDSSYVFAQMADWPEFERRLGGLVDCHSALAKPFHRVGYLSALFDAAASLVGINRCDEIELAVALPLPLAALDFKERDSLTVSHLLPASMVRDIGLAAKLAGFRGATVMPSVATLRVDDGWNELIPQAQPKRFGCAIEVGVHELAIIPFQLEKIDSECRARPVERPIILPLGKQSLFEGIRHAIDSSGESPLTSEELVKRVLQRACGVSATEFLAGGYCNELREDASPVESQSFEEWLKDALIDATGLNHAEAEEKLRPGELIRKLTGNAINEIWLVAMNGIAARVMGVKEAFKRRFCGVLESDRGVKPGCLWSGYMPPNPPVAFVQISDIGPIHSRALSMSAGSSGMGRLSKVEIRSTKNIPVFDDDMGDKPRPHMTRCTAFWVEPPGDPSSESLVPFEVRLEREGRDASLFEIDVELNQWERSQAVELEVRFDRFDRVSVSIMVGGTPSPAEVRAKSASGSKVDPAKLIQERDLGEFILYLDEDHQKLLEGIPRSEDGQFRHRIFNPRLATA